MHAQYIQLPFDTYITDCCITKDTKYGLYFGDCLGVLDGIHISVLVPYENHVFYQN